MLAYLQEYHKNKLLILMIKYYNKNKKEGNLIKKHLISKFIWLLNS